MKHLKKLGGVLLALVMVMALAAPAFAAVITPESGLEGEFGGGSTLTTPEDKIHATNVTAGDTVNYYQLVEWDSANRTWKLTATHGAAISAAPYSITLDDLLDGINEEEAGKIATALAGTTADGAMTPDSTGGTNYSAPVTPGLYYLKAIPGADNTTTIYNPAFVSADYHQDNNTVDFGTAFEGTAVLKKSGLTFDKTVDSLNPIEFVDVKPGDVIPYKITTKIPAYGPEFTNAEFKVSDTLTNLALGDVISVTYGTTTTAVSDSNVTITKVDNTFTVAFTEQYLLNADRGAVDVTITYSGKVPDDAPFNVNYMNNTATLTYTSKPNGDSATKKDTTNHYNFTIDGSLAGSSTENLFEIYKTGVDANGNEIMSGEYHIGSDTVVNNMLAGATFTLTPYKDADGNEITNPVALTATSGPDGRITFKGLEEGIYKLEETAAPNGYVKDGTTYYVKIDAKYTKDPVKNGSDENIADMLDDYTIGIYSDEACSSDKLIGSATYDFEITNQGPTSTKITDAGNKLNIVNKQGTELPSTGGIGTTLFYVVGGVLVVGAVVLLITKRRASADDE